VAQAPGRLEGSFKSRDNNKVNVRFQNNKLKLRLTRRQGVCHLRYHVTTWGQGMVGYGRVRFVYVTSLPGPKPYGLLLQCLHIFHTVSESMFHKYVVQLMSTPIS